LVPGWKSNDVNMPNPGREIPLPAAVADILAFLCEHFGEDFLSYSDAVATKRIEERAAQLSFRDLSEYRSFLGADLLEPDLLARMLRIRFSSFFRDQLQFELIGTVIVPPMLHGSRRALFRGWSAACASGEEAYSLAIVLDEAMQGIGHKGKVQIFATDIAEDALDEGRLGVYLPDRLGGVTLKRLGTYFTAGKQGYQVVEKLRGAVTFSRYDLLDRKTYVPPESLFGGFDLVLCRNFLMYLEREAYSRVFDKIFRALNPGGVLMLGKAESVPDRYAPYLERVVEFGNLYRKKS
jgi:chemotaxis protein methyltransferase CheR